MLNNDTPEENTSQPEKNIKAKTTAKATTSKDQEIITEKQDEKKETQQSFTPAHTQKILFKSNESKQRQAQQEKEIRNQKKLIAQQNREIALLQSKNQKLNNERTTYQQQLDDNDAEIASLQSANQELSKKTENINKKSDAEKMKERIVLQPKNDLNKTAKVTEKEDEDKEEPSNFSGLTEFGFTYEKDNKKTQTLEGRMMLDYTEKDKYSLNTDYEFEFETEDSIQSTNKSRWQTQADYNLTPISTVFIRSDLNSSKYSSYDKENIYAAGYGRDIYKSKKQNLHIEVGPGYRQAVPNVGQDAVTVNEVIARVRVQYDLIFSETLELKLDTVTEIGNENNIYSASFSLQKNIYRQLYLVYDFEYKYTENVPIDTVQDEISSGLKLLYAF